jgi:hypothetical protein
VPVTDVLPLCGDDEPERNAGGPIDDGWPDDRIDESSVNEEVSGDGVDPGAVPGQPAG